MCCNLSGNCKLLSPVEYRQQNVINTAVINKVNTGSDHRLVRCTTKFDIEKERAKLMCRKGKIDIEKLEEYRYLYEVGLNNRFKDLDIKEPMDKELYEKFSNTVTSTAEEVAGIKKKK